MNLLDEIREAFAYLKESRTARLKSLPKEYPGFVYRNSDYYFGVAIEAPKSPAFSEAFSGARMRTVAEKGGFGGQLLCLESRQTRFRNEFAVVCAQFLEPGDLGANRALLEADPQSWWERWRDLLGNAVRHRPAYSVLGELLAFEVLLAREENPRWQGPTSGSQDLVGERGRYEIKSTVSRYGSIVRIAGQFQLMMAEHDNLFLVHQRFEPSPDGDSIERVLERLRARGADFDTLTSLVTSEGIEEGAVARKERYRLLESTQYRVDDKFPRIVPAGFLGGTLPKGVVSIQYDVDLSGLEAQPFGEH